MTKKKVNALIALAVIGFVVYVVISSVQLAKVSCEVCMEFRGSRVCRTASGVSREEAIDTARNNACAQIARGRTESILCGGSPPASVECTE